MTDIPRNETISEPVTWHGCYADSWRNLIVPEAFAHPAKFAPGLIRRIYRHGLERGYWRKGDVVGDPFGGIAGGGVIGAYLGLAWLGVELEEKFVDLGRQNIAKHRGKWQVCGDPEPVLIEGDSREFAAIVGNALDAVVTSPPYAALGADTKGHGIKGAAGSIGHGCKADDAEYGSTPGQIGALKCGDLDAVVTSPPWADETSAHCGSSANEAIAAAAKRLGKSMQDVTPFEAGRETGYGDTPGQIGALKAGALDAVVTSPPFSQIVATQDPNFLTPGERGKRSPSKSNQPSYGDTPGQIGALKSGDLDAVVTSPPYAETSIANALGGNQIDHRNLGRNTKDKRGLAVTPQAADTQQYGTTPGQIGALKSGDLDAVVTSPPYAESEMGGGGEGPGAAGAPQARRAGKHSGAASGVGYGSTPGQIGALKSGSIQNPQSEIENEPDTYWHAMHAVYTQCLSALKPGGVMAVVIKDYVKGGERVPLCDQTLALLVFLGFEPVERVRAMLVSETVEAGLFGEIETRKERKSFFRRLAERNARAALYWTGLTRSEQAAALWAAHEQVRAAWLDEVAAWQAKSEAERRAEAKDKDMSIDDVERYVHTPPERPGRWKVEQTAHISVYMAAGSPMLDIATAIDWEEVLFVRKA